MSKRLNEPFIDMLDQLSTIMLKHGEPFRARAYQKAQETIMSLSHTDITTPQELKGKPGIGDTIMEKLKEYAATGTLRILEQEKANPVNILADIYGVGPKKAQELVEKGITSVQQLRDNQQLLNDVQRVGLHYYEDILKRIPRQEIEQYKAIFEQAMNDNDAKMEIVGSYRRGAASSGDIDVILTSSSPHVFTAFVDKLLARGVILHVLSRGPCKCLVITKLGPNESARRVDFLYTSPAEFPFAILYFTGSKIFNTVMRQVAVEQGYSMNEHGMTYGKKGEKVAHPFATEADIFAFLGLEYKKPTERIDGRAINKVSPSTQLATINKVSPSTQLVTALRAQGVQVLDQCSESQLTTLLQQANHAYHNATHPFMTDSEFDLVKSYVDTKYAATTKASIGAPVEKGKTKVTLPYSMGSMDKIKPDTNALAGWCAKFRGPYLVSCKLDGVSGLYSTEGKEPKLYTRGDGTVGQDISHLIPYLRLPKVRGIVLRGEFILPRTVFEQKYKSIFANPRNMVAGIVNNKAVHEAIQDVHFVAYEVIQPVCPPSKQFAFLSTLDVEIVRCQSFASISNDMLSTTLVEWRSNYLYEIDGIIVTNDSIHERKPGNPEHAFAFKMVLTEQVVEATVVDVLWAASKDGYLKPRVQIEPVNLGGVQIAFATGFNAAFIEEQGIGVGAVVELIRSGDVIPYIRKVLVRASQPKMPSVSYTWNATHVDIVLQDMEADETVKEKNLTGFFRGIGVEGLSTGNIKRMMEAGFDSVPKVLQMTLDDFFTVEGFKEKTATKLRDGIRERVESASLVTLMSASNMFGRGFSEKKLELIMESLPDVLVSKDTDKKKVAQIEAIKGMANKTAEAFVERIPDFVQFLHACGLAKKLVNTPVSPVVVHSGHPLFGKSVVLTGFRDEGIQTFLKSVGAKLGSSVSSKTFALVVKDHIGDETGKVLEAKKLNVPLMTLQQFRASYLS